MAFHGAGSAQEFGSSDIHIVKVIGTGSFGKVMQGKLLDTTDVAVKCVKVRHERRTDMEFEAEVSTLFRLCHSRIVRLYGICKIEDYYCLVMEFCPYSLFKVLNATKAHKKELPVGLKWRFIREIAEAVHFLHKQPKKLLHLDLKSGNILLTEDLRIKLCDFGLSVWQKYSTRHSFHSEDTVSTRGTRTHMAPEMLTNVHLFPSAKCDVYSFSIVMWEVLQCSTDPYPNVCFGEQIVYAVGREDNYCRPTYNFSFDQSNVYNAENIPVSHNSSPEEIVSALAQLMRICWDPDPGRRPAFTAICNCLERIGQTPFCCHAGMRKDAADFHHLLEKCLKQGSGSSDGSDDLFAADTCMASGPLGDILQRVMTMMPNRQVPHSPVSPGPPTPFRNHFQPFKPPPTSPQSEDVDIQWFVEANKTPLTLGDLTGVAETFVDPLNIANLSTALDLSEVDVNQIKLQYQPQGPRRVARTLLDLWRTQRGEYATKGMLYSVLKDKNLRDAACALALPTTP